MAKVYFINAEFYKEVVPSTRSIDEAQIIAAIKLVQETDIVSIVTQEVYDYFENLILTSGTFSASEKIVFKDMQMLEALLTAEQLTFIAPKRDSETKSTANVSYRNKISILEARVIRGIKNDPAMLLLAQGSPVGFDDVEMDLQGGFYFDS